MENIDEEEGEIEKENVVNNEAEEEGVDDQDVQNSVPIVDFAGLL